MASANVLTLFTSGYAGLSIDQFLSRLRAYRITTVVDVRQLPVSRNHSFSKQHLKETLQLNGFNYVHLPELGSPPELRQQLKQGLAFSTFAALYQTHLAEQKSTVQDLLDLVHQEACCLLCVETLPTSCHRSYVAARLQQLDGNGLEISHL